MSIDNQRINKLAIKMGIRLVDKARDEIAIGKCVSFSKMLSISKPNRPEVKEHFQKQLENIK